MEDIMVYHDSQKVIGRLGEEKATQEKDVSLKERRDNLYIDMDGVLVSMAEDTKYPTLVPDAIKFLGWAVQKFRCFYLTCWCAEEIYKTFPMLPKFPVRRWDDVKTSGIDFSKTFYWLEDGCTKAEYEILKTKGVEDSYIQIDPRDDLSLTKLMEGANV